MTRTLSPDRATRARHPAASAFHLNTCRWPHNTLVPEEEPWAGAPFKDYPGVAAVRLPPAGRVEMALDAAIRARVSCRKFAADALGLEDLGTLLALAYGVHGVAPIGSRELLERPVPSGGGLYPLEFYVIARRVGGLTPGVFHYAPLDHALDPIREVAFSDGFISQLFMNQPYLAGAAAILVISAVLERAMHKYGDRGYRYILMEAGHAAQNVCLVAAATGVGALPLGGFFDGYLAGLLEIDSSEEAVLYALGLGRPVTADRVATRNLDVLIDA